MAARKRIREPNWCSGTGAFDHRLSALTARQSQRVRDLSRHVLAERGIEAVVHADRLETADGRVFGLENLASKCYRHGFGEEAWISVVAAHFDALLAEFGAVPPVLSAADLRAGAYLRLVPLDAVTHGLAEKGTYVRRLGGGLCEVIAHKSGDFVRWLNDDDVAKVGVEELRTLGRERLRQIRPDECQVLRNEVSAIYVARGDSGFIASKLLVLDDIVRVVLGPKASYPDGLLVAVPNRYELAFVPLDADTVANLAGMLSFTAAQFTRGLAPLMPHVYWWRDGELTQLTDIDRTGAINLAVLPELVEVVNRLQAGRDAA